MQVKIKIFGQLTDIIQEPEFTLTDIRDTDSLQEVLKSRFPALGGAKYMMAVDKQTVTGNTILKEGATVALLPPFSGG